MAQVFDNSSGTRNRFHDLPALDAAIAATNQEAKPLQPIEVVLDSFGLAGGSFELGGDLGNCPSPLRVLRSSWMVASWALTTHASSDKKDDRFAASLQQSLQDMAAQLGEVLEKEAAAVIYQEACDLLGHIPYSPITLARVAGTRLVYRVHEAEPGELDWLKF